MITPSESSSSEDESRQTGEGGLLKLADGTDTLQVLRDAGLRIKGDLPPDKKPDDGLFRASFGPH